MLSEISQIAYCCLEKDIQASLVVQLVKNIPAMEETLFQFLGQEDFSRGGHGNPLQYSILESPQGQRGLVGYSPWGHKEPDTTERLSSAKHSPQNREKPMTTLGELGCHRVQKLGFQSKFFKLLCKILTRCIGTFIKICSTKNHSKIQISTSPSR